jgi:RND family efflux transporter MFP subunit
MIRRHSFFAPSSLLLVLAGALSGCGPNAPPVAETPPPTVSVSQPVVRDVIDYDEYEGRIGAFETVDVRARVRGHLDKVAFQAGQMVKKDDPLYEIDPRPYQAALDAAKAQEKASQAALQYARAEYDRVRPLVAKGAATREELDTWVAKQAVSSADVLKAQANIEEAQLNLDYTKVKAPFAGKIGRTLVDVGNLINAGGGETLLTTIVATEPMYVYFTVDERSLQRYKESRRKQAKAGEPQPDLKELHIPVHVALEGEEGYPHKGEIDFADNRLTRSTGTFEARGVLSNAEHIYEDGMRARVRVPVGELPKSLLITERAIGNDQDRKFVYVVNDQNVAERRDVKLGRLSNGLQVVQEGLKPEDWVIVNGIQRVRDGAKVEPKKIPMPGAPADQNNQEPKN